MRGQKYETLSRQVVEANCFHATFNVYQRVCGLAETMLLTARDGSQKLLKLLFNCLQITINEKLSVRGLAHHNLTQFQPTKTAF